MAVPNWKDWMDSQSDPTDPPQLRRRTGRSKQVRQRGPNEEMGSNATRLIRTVVDETSDTTIT